MRTLPDADERPHLPGPEESWQESVIVSFYAERSGIGGFCRLAHEPNRRRGNLTCGLFARDGTRFRRSVQGVPISDSDRWAEGFGAAGYSVQWDGRLRVEGREPECEFSLEIEDLHPRFDYWSLVTMGRSGDEVAPNHFEAGGNARGTVTLAGREYPVDGLAYRDHSWGPRNWGAVLSHRWFVGTFGPALTFSLVTVHPPGGPFERFGYLIRDGEPCALEDLDVLVDVEPDGLTCRGARAVGRAGADEVRLGCEVLDGVVLDVGGFVAVEGIARARTHDGALGFATLEVSNNARAGRAAPTLALRANLVEGITRGRR